MRREGGVCRKAPPALIKEETMNKYIKRFWAFCWDLGFTYGQIIMLGLIKKPKNPHKD